MSTDWARDIREMHGKYDIQAVVDAMDDETKESFLQFRLNFLKEELDETFDAYFNDEPEEIVDGLIDLCVVAIGTLDLLGVDAHKAWDEVLKANMAKEVGIKEGRPNPHGLPDLIKPEGWVAPSHEGNTGTI